MAWRAGGTAFAMVGYASLTRPASTPTTCAKHKTGQFVPQGIHCLETYSNGVYHSGMITIAETRMFQGKATRLLSARERDELIAYLAEHPAAGVVMEGTGGIRKLRWARSGRGKRGGVRVIYYFHDESMPLYLLTVFSKNEKANLSKAERNLLSSAVRKLVAFWRQKNGQSLH